MKIQYALLSRSLAKETRITEYAAKIDTVFSVGSMRRPTRAVLSSRWVSSIRRFLVAFLAVVHTVWSWLVG